MSEHATEGESPHDDEQRKNSGAPLAPDDVADAPNAEAAAPRALDAKNVTLEEPTRSTPSLVEQVETVGWIDGAGSFVSISIDLGGEPVTVTLQAEEARRLADAVEASVRDAEELREEASRQPDSGRGRRGEHE